jgi:lipocalin
VNATYTPNADGTVGVWNQAVNWLGDYSSIRGTAKVKNASEPAAFIVTFDNPSRVFFGLNSLFVSILYS